MAKNNSMDLDIKALKFVFEHASFQVVQDHRFDFTLLFEQSILSILPSVVLLLLVPVRLYQLRRSPLKTVPDPLQHAKFATATLYAALQLALLVAWTRTSVQRNNVSIPSATVSFINAIAILILSIIEHRRSIRPSSLLNLYLFFSLLFDATQARTLFLEGVSTSVSGVFTAGIGVKVLLLCLEAQDKRSFLRNPFNQYSPEATSGIFSRSLLLWLNRLFRVGFRSLIAPTDLITIDENFKSETLGFRMQEAWDKRTKPEGKFTLPKVILWCFRGELLSVAYYRLLLIGFNYAQPFLITRAIDFVSQPVSPSTKNTGYGLIAATFLVYTGLALINMRYHHQYNRAAIMFRGGMTSLLYAKTLTMQDGVHKESAVLTLMSTDIDRITAIVQDANDIWASVIEVAIGVWLLERQLGAVCIIPLALVGMGVFGQSWIAKHIGGRQKRWNEAVQLRVTSTSSMLGSMKAVKMMGLASILQKMVQNLRLQELRHCASWMNLIIVMNFISNTMADWAPVLTFIAYIAKAHAQGTQGLSTAQAFTSLAIISLVTNPAVQAIQAIPRMASSLGNFARLQAYLLSPVIQDERQTCDDATPRRMTSQNPQDPEEGTELITIRPTTSPQSYDEVVILNRATISAAPGLTPAVTDISMSVVKSDLVIIVGPVGSGKSTLLKGILGELTCASGAITVSSKKMAYCGQTPWLLNTSIQQIICGMAPGLAVDERWYQKVLHACALDEDLRRLPEGDLSIVGSKGLTLSGGQKQRLALARAVYARQDVILLDDVISALDSKTEDLVVKRLFGKEGLLRSLGTTILLVTHATRHLPLADKIIVLTSDGEIDQQGSYQQLRSSEGFVKSVSAQDRAFEGGETPQDSVSLARKVGQGPTPEQVYDLTRRTGDMSVYKYYFMTIKKSSVAIFLATNVVYAFCYGFLQVWLQLFTKSNDPNIPLFIGIYVLLAVVTDLSLTGTLVACFLRILPESAANLHDILLKTTMRATQKFFMETDTGISLNRFSQDMTLIDSQLPTALMVTVTQLFTAMVQSALICSGSTWMAITLPVILFVLYFIQNVYLKTSRQMRFLDLEAKSPVYSHLLETLEGLPVIRAFGWQKEATETHLARLDASQTPYYLMLCLQRWLALVLDLLVAGMAVTVVALAVELRSSTTAGLLGIALTNVLTFNSTLSGLVQQWTSLETSLGAISRVRTFANTTTSEDRPEECQRPPAEWPSHGAIEIRNLSATYGDGSLVLKNIQMSMKPGQRIGICGRTGSGKSSLLLTILRLLDLDAGDITIDGFSLSTIPREMIRSRLIAIPQEPFMLPGSVRLNADPTATASDEKIILALVKIGLWRILEARGGLDAGIHDQPLSHGQQQLFCLARAMLRKSKVLILDEATSNVDAETDRFMQRIIREEFKEHTIITVAHRLDTIIDSDMIAVLDQGQLVEFDSPENLLARDSAFRQLYGARTLGSQ